MRETIRNISACIFSAINGSAMSNEMKMANIFGTKAMVISWICVRACRSEMATPTASPTSMTGLETTMSVKIASRETSRTSGPVMMFDSFRCRARPQLDRHLHDVFVGRDDTIAHCDDGIDGNLGFGDRSDDIDDIGLAAGGSARLRIGFAAHFGD